MPPYAAAVCFAIARFLLWPTDSFQVEFEPGETHVVTRVVDGDTLELDNGDRVRLIGVDTPSVDLFDSKQLLVSYESSAELEEEP